MSETPACAFCGRELDSHNRDIRFGLPDPVLAIPETEREARTWGNDVLMAVEAVGAFVRVLLPVRLSGGYSIRFGLWLAVPGDDLRRAYAVWWEESYQDLTLNGRIANAVPPWGNALLGAAAWATVRDRDQVPYVTSTSDATLSKVLEHEWDHDYVLEPWLGSTDLLPPVPGD